MTSDLVDRSVRSRANAHADFIQQQSSSFSHYRFLGTRVSLSWCQVHNGRNAHPFALQYLLKTRTHICGLLCILLRVNLVLERDSGKKNNLV